MFARMSGYHLIVLGITLQQNTPIRGSNGIVRYYPAVDEWKTSGLLIRGFGVRVPGGAPVLTWCCTRFGRPRGGRFGAMFAPRLLVSPDLVPRAVLGGLAH